MVEGEDQEEDPAFVLIGRGGSAIKIEMGRYSTETFNALQAKEEKSVDLVKMEETVLWVL